MGTRGPFPTPPHDASATSGGLLNTLAQAIAGLKNFVHGLLWRGHQVGARALGNVTIYVDGVNGDDDNDGLTTATAVQTVEEANRRVPASLVGPSSKVVVELAGVGGFYPNATAQLDYEVENLLFPSGGNAEHQRFHYRGPNMVRCPDLASGPNVGVISALTNLWWPCGISARTRVASVTFPLVGQAWAQSTFYAVGTRRDANGKSWVCITAGTSANSGTGPAGADDVGQVADGSAEWRPAYQHAGTRISRVGGAAWTENDPKMRFLRITRGGRKVIFEVPIARNGDFFIDLDISRMPNLLKLADALQLGDQIEVVKCGVRFINSAGISISIEGHGGCSGPYDHSTDIATRGGGGAWLERVECHKRFMAWGCWGLSQDRVDQSTDGDENYYGGSGTFVNVLHTSLGLLLHGGWTGIHDTANCRPDVISNDPAVADPIYQDVDAFSCFGVLRNRCRLFVGSGTSTSPAYLTLERNLSVYDANANAGIFLGYGARFSQLDQRNRNVHVQGNHNATIGVDVMGGSQFKFVIDKMHVCGDGELGNLYDDARLGTGATKTFDEVQYGTGLTLPSVPSNWLSSPTDPALFNFSRITAYEG